MKKEFRQKLYLGLPLENFLAEAELQCDVFVYLPINEKMVKVSKSGQSLTATRLENYSKKNLENLFILEPFDNPNAYKFRNGEALNPVLPPEYTSTEPKVKSYELEEVEREEKEMVTGELGPEREEKEWATAEADPEREEKEWATAEADPEREEKEWATAEADPEREEAEKRFGSESIQTDQVRRVTGSKEEVDNSVRRVSGGNSTEKEERKFRVMTSSGEDEARKVAGKNLEEKDDSIVVKGSEEKKEGGFNLNVKPYSGEDKQSPKRNMRVSSSLNEEEAKDKDGFAVRVSQKELNQHLSEQAKKANEIIRIKGDGDDINQDLNAKRDIKSLVNEKDIAEIQELQDKLEIPDEIKNMDEERLKFFSTKEKYAAEEVALLEGELQARIEMNKAMLVLVKTNPADLPESEYRTFVKETKHAVNRSMTARALASKLTVKRQEFCETSPAEDERRIALMTEINRIQDQIVSIATNPNYDLSKTDVDSVDSGWLNDVDFKESKEDKLASIEKNLTKLTDDLVPAKSDLVSGQADYAEKVRNESGSLELTEASSKLPISKQAINLAGHAVFYAISSGYRNEESLQDFALVALAEFAADEMDPAVIPEKVQKNREAILGSSNKSPLWYRDMRNAIELSREFSSFDESIQTFFSPEPNIFESNYTNLEAKNIVDRQFLTQARSYLKSKKPKTLNELPIQVATYATKAANIWINGEEAVMAAATVESEIKGDSGNSDDAVA